MAKRLICCSQIFKKTLGNNLQNKSQSSQDWLNRQLNDPYVKRARYQNYRARSAFKLIEIDDKHHIIKPGMVVVECGAAPGAFTQVLVQRLKLDERDRQKTGAVIAIDMKPIHHIEGAILLPLTDFTKPLNQAKVLSAINGKSVDLVVSDMAPNATGDHEYDHQNILHLCYSAFQFSVTVLKPITGTLLTKIWEGSLTKSLIKDLERFFVHVKQLKPDASRPDSTEAYILAKNFKGIK